MNKKIINLLKKIRNKYELYFKHNSFKKKGKNNIIKYDKGCRFYDCHFVIHGNNNVITIGENCSLGGVRILIEGDNNMIKFGKKVVVNAFTIQPTVINAIGGKKIIIGDGALLSNNIEIHTSDYHGIYNSEGKRINHDKDVVIGKDVWIGLGCKIFKGAKIAEGSIIGAGSLVSRVFDEPNVIIAGNPSNIIKHHVFWKAERKEEYPVPNQFEKLMKLTD